MAGTLWLKAYTACLSARGGCASIPRDARAAAACVKTAKGGNRSAEKESIAGDQKRTCCSRPVTRQRSVAQRARQGGGVRGALRRRRVVALVVHPLKQRAQRRRMAAHGAAPQRGGATEEEREQVQVRPSCVWKRWSQFSLRRG